MESDMESVGKIAESLILVPSEGFEPPSLASKAVVLSVELRGPDLITKSKN